MQTLLQALLPEAARAMLASTVDAVRARPGSGCAGPAETRSLEVAGAAGLRQAPEAHGPVYEDAALDASRPVAGSSFALPLDAGDGGPSASPNCAVFWGSGDYRALSGGGAVDWDGGVTSGHLGADVRLGGDLLAGLSLSLSELRFDYSEGSGAAARTGTYGSTLTGIAPYAGLTLPGGIELWALAGYGRGDVALAGRGAARRSSELRQSSMAAGMEGALYSGDELLAGGATTVDLKAEGWYARAAVVGSKTLAAATASVNRLRMTLEAAHARALAGGAVLTPSVAVGLRRDGGSGATGSGVEVAGGLSWRDASRRLTLEGRGRALVGHGGGTEEWGVGGLLRVDPGEDGRGLWLSFAPGVGVARNVMDGQ